MKANGGQWGGESKLGVGNFYLCIKKKPTAFLISPIRSLIENHPISGENRCICFSKTG